ncbi:MAG: family 43 glycosylhydrolase [Armatimonadetes bacterium]|nr:family 43 glycosylhydrolase [Armatimonadota bacterium]
MRFPSLRVAAGGLLAAVAGIVFLSGAWPAPARVSPKAKVKTMNQPIAVIRNAMNPADQEGRKLHAHGGSMIKVGEKWCWFGEKPRYRNWFFDGVNCYSSPDLQRWRYEGTALSASETGNLSHSKVAYRPKVVYNSRTAKYVMMLTECSADCSDGHLCFATSDTVTGPYTYSGWCYGAGGKHVMDMTVFKDDDGQAYVFYSANTDRTGHWVDRLSDDYLSVEANAGHPSTHDRDAPCVFKREGRYFLYFSECTGWSPNQGHYVTASSLAGPWSEESPFGDAATYRSQGSFIFAVTGASGVTFIYTGDRWNAAGSSGAGDPCDYQKSEYIWLPIRITGSRMSIRYEEQWFLNIRAGTWSARSLGP